LNEKPGIRIINEPFLADDVYFVTGIKSDKSILKKSMPRWKKAVYRVNFPSCPQLYCPNERSIFSAKEAKYSFLH